ncbi:MAG: hypothetical protein VB121_12050, partial [Enterococcus thailandicus]|nr:hypothetical protein [Enterococcus thailandicus]
ISFAGWNLFGSFAVVMKNQGVNILLNVFFGPVVNAARGVSSQVSTSLTSFVVNFQTALRPQIIKSYASENIKYHLELVFSGAKYSYFLLYLLSLPILLETETILQLWLKIVPEFSVIFVRLVIIAALIDSLSVTLMASIQATGKIKLYQVVIGLLMFSILPISYVFFKLGFSPQSTYYVALVIFIFIVIARIFTVKKQISFLIGDYMNQVISKAFFVTVFSVLLSYSVLNFMEVGLLRLLVIFIIAIFSTLIGIYFFGINENERYKTHKFIISLYRRLKKK